MHKPIIAGGGAICRGAWCVSRIYRSRVVAADKKHGSAATREFAPCYVEACSFDLALEVFQTIAAIADLPFMRLPLGLTLDGEAPEKSEFVDMAASAPALTVEL